MNFGNTHFISWSQRYISALFCSQIDALYLHIIISIYFKAASTLKFFGNNSMSLRYETSVKNEADDVIIRVRSMEQNALLMSTRHDRSSDRLELTLDAGRVKIFLQVGYVFWFCLSNHTFMNY